MQLRSGSLLVSTVVAAVTVAACGGKSGDGATNESLISSGDPAKVCASAETMDALRNVALKDIKGEDGLNPSYIQELKSGTVVTVDLPALESFDKVTKKVVCTAKVKFSWPKDVVAKLRSYDPNYKWESDEPEGHFEVQPAADSGLIYTIDGDVFNVVEGSTSQMLATLARGDAAASQAAADAKRVPTPAPSSASVDASPTTPAATDPTAPAPPADNAAPSTN
jgi:hypothetical protein